MPWGRLLVGIFLDVSTSRILAIVVTPHTIVRTRKFPIVWRSQTSLWIKCAHIWLSCTFPYSLCIHIKSVPKPSLRRKDFADIGQYSKSSVSNQRPRKPSIFIIVMAYLNVPKMTILCCSKKTNVVTNFPCYIHFSQESCKSQVEMKYF